MDRFKVSLGLAATFLSGAIFLVACTSEDVKVGSSDQKLQKLADGGSTGNGQTCSWDDAVSYDTETGETTYHPSPNGPYQVGDEFPSLDGCNRCTCTEQGIACTEMACNPPGNGGASCEYHGHTWASGTKVPSLDNCNSCFCENGDIACTAMGCEYKCPTETFIDCEPIVPEERLALCYGSYHDWIAQNCPGITFGL